MNLKIKKESVVLSIIFTFIFQIVCVVMLIIGKFTFFQFIVSLTLLDILSIHEKRELERFEGDADGSKSWNN